MVNNPLPLVVVTLIEVRWPRCVPGGSHLSSSARKRALQEQPRMYCFHPPDLPACTGRAAPSCRRDGLASPLHGAPAQPADAGCPAAQVVLLGAVEKYRSDGQGPPGYSPGVGQFESDIFDGLDNLYPGAPAHLVSDSTPQAGGFRT